MKAPTGRNAPESVLNLDIKALIIMIVICSSWGLNHPLTKLAYVDISPILAAAIRSLLAAAGLLIYCRAVGMSLEMAVRMSAFGIKPVLRLNGRPIQMEQHAIGSRRVEVRCLTYQSQPTGSHSPRWAPSSYPTCPIGRR